MSFLSADTVTVNPWIIHLAVMTLVAGTTASVEGKLQYGHVGTVRQIWLVLWLPMSHGTDNTLLSSVFHHFFSPYTWDLSQPWQWKRTRLSTLEQIILSWNHPFINRCYFHDVLHCARLSGAKTHACETIHWDMWCHILLHCVGINEY